jgi:hypothetical protein
MFFNTKLQCKKHYVSIVINMLSTLFDQSNVATSTSQDYSYDSSLDMSYLSLGHVAPNTIRIFSFSNRPSWLANFFY